jgi:hypothetical protein
MLSISRSAISRAASAAISSAGALTAVGRVTFCSGGALPTIHAAATTHFPVESYSSNPGRGQAAAIVIGFAFVSSRFGKTIFRMPSLYSAVTLSPLTAVGSAKERLKLPYARSTR